MNLALLLPQAPLPPLPPLPQTPLPPLPPGFYGLPIEVAVLTALGILVTAVILFPVARALARRLEGKAGREVRAELDALHQRVAELEEVESRLAELENRVEFSERLLTQRGDRS